MAQDAAHRGSSGGGVPSEAAAPPVKSNRKVAVFVMPAKNPTQKQLRSFKQSFDCEPTGGVGEFVSRSL